MNEKKQNADAPKTIEQLTQENEALKKLLEKSKKAVSLPEQMKFFQEKTKKIAVLEQFKEVKEKLTDFISQVKEETTKGVFNSDKFVVVFGNKGYNSRVDELFKVSKSELLERMAFFMVGETDKKIKMLESEILTD